MSEYKISKHAGSRACVEVKNLTSCTSVIVGPVTITILETLKKEGYTLHSETDAGEKELNIYDEWDFNISEATAHELASKAMPMKKPTRIKKEKEVEQPKTNKEINAMDVLLGLAKYN